ncbi:MAG: HNH endonuclease [Chloroflexi bacterium]|nr:HNH endonuclease [Chloroflexota bacterium]
MTPTGISLTPIPNLAIERLAASFSNVTNSYKFYWFLAILQHLKETDEPIIPVEPLLARMVAQVWYPTNYFYLSFGKQDRLSQIALTLKLEYNLPITASTKEVMQAVFACLESSTSKKSQQEIKSLAAYVPYRFLRPFFLAELRGELDWKINNRIIELAQHHFSDTPNPPLYRFCKTERDTPAIELHPLWVRYLQQHLPILLGFVHWHLLNYLQKNNPNVPNIAAKLFEPQQRDLNQSRQFWRLALAGLGTIRCIYSGEEMHRIESLDHFLPWSFVTHDLLWNIIPTPKNINAAKNDQLPRLPDYFEPFAQLQYEALQIVARSAQARLLEDYVLLYKKQTIAEVAALPSAMFKGVLHDTIAPQMQIARNMGFAPDWRWSYR